jgi:hypothetical protein
MNLSSKKLMLSLTVSLSLAAVAALGTGCAASQQHLTKGEIAYNAGDYPTAKTELTNARDDSREYSGQQLAQLALYRGLTAVALGDRVEAGKYLAEAKIREAKDPGSLSPDERAKMEQGLKQILTDPPR